ncbi:Hypothetical protein, putative [Bodo saltans]|uniref:ribonuclease P n=1 Tax=Bodo saltans TaxID=75058 RepID=A0A0S4IT05_BODSA|nr:Hypothetical protein, putative [Bodo saltans]|eukprot:CUE73241.1 Hypothetical protein, putative [Bodo saltans]
MRLWLRLWRVAPISTHCTLRFSCEKLNQGIAPPEGKSKKRVRHPIDGFIAAGDMTAAFAALQSIPANELNPKHVAAVLHMTEKEGHRDMTAVIVERIVRSNSSMWDENILSVWLRHQCHSGDFQAAWATASMIASRSGGLWKKRNLSPLLAFACLSGQRANVMELLHHARTCSVPLDVDDVHVLVRYFSSTHEPLTTLHHLLQLVVEYLPHINGETASFLEHWCKAVGGVTAATTCVDPSSGMCACCGTQMHGLPFTAEHKEKVLEGIRVAAGVTRRNDAALAARRKRSFEAWTKSMITFAPLQTADILIDGANVGYYGLSSWYHIVKEEMVKHCTAHFPDRLARLHKGTTWSKKLPFVDVPVSMELIDEAMSQAKAAGLRPLLLLHERHVEPHNMFPKAHAILNKWKAANEVITTPGGLNDDVCWLHAAITRCTPTDVGATTGQRPDLLVLTNDAMRDHHFQLLHQRSFVAWRGRHQVKFSCVRENECTRVQMTPPSTFTSCIQHNVARCAWHLPVIEATVGETVPELEDKNTTQWLCIR